MNKDDVLKVARGCSIPESDVENLIEHQLDGLERFAAAMYAKGAEDMRERAAKKCLAVHHKRTNDGRKTGYNAIMDCVDDIRALPITTNTEGEQG